MLRRLSRFSAFLKRRPKTPEEIAADREAARIADEIASTRIASKSHAGENYLTQRRTRY